MSNFKIQYVPSSSQIEARTAKFPLADVSLNFVSMNALTYEIDQLIETIQQHLQGQTQYHNLCKAIKVLSNSLNQSKTFKKLEDIIEKYMSNAPKMYQLISMWTKVVGSSMSIIQKLTQSNRKKVTNIIFTTYFLKASSIQSKMCSELSLILKLSDASQILSVLKTSYEKQGKPLQNAIQQCMTVSKQRSQLKNLSVSFLVFAIESSQRQVIEMVQKINENRQLFQIANQVSSINNILLKNIKKTLKEDNILQVVNKNIFEALTIPSAKEWLQDDNNYWKLVDKHYCHENHLKILQIGKMVPKQGLASKCLASKYFHLYLSGNSFNFQAEDSVIIKNNIHDQWTQVYKSISLCQSYENFNLITLNVSNAIKHWNVCNPFQITTNSKGLNKLISFYRQFFEQTKQKYLKNNKKLSIAYSTFYVQEKGKEAKWITFEQLKTYLDQNKPIQTCSFKDEYVVFEKKSIIAVKQQKTKDHNIVVEAKLVRLLKRNKQSGKKQWLCAQTNYTPQIVESGLKRLQNKGIVELDESRMIYNYIP